MKKDIIIAQWRNQIEKATWATDQQAGISFGGGNLPSPWFFEGNIYVSVLMKY